VFSTRPLRHCLADPFWEADPRRNLELSVVSLRADPSWINAHFSMGWQGQILALKVKALRPF